MKIINGIILLSTVSFSLMGMIEPGSLRPHTPNAIVKAVSDKVEVQNGPSPQRNRLRYSREELEKFSLPDSPEAKKQLDDYIESIKPALDKMHQELKAHSSKR